MAFALTKRDLPHRNIVMGIVVFSMLFNPGIVPNYLNIKNLGLINNRWVLILPALTNSFNLIVARSFLDTIPAELDESAKLDGCNDIQVFFRIILPLSTAALATMTLFFAVGHWNTYFSSLIYLSDIKKRTLQVYVRQLIVDSSGSGASENDVFNIPSETLRLATVMLAMLPILVVYPFVQRYFIKGVMLGSVKG
jgi:putative aldouronate transport system permease protein